MFRTILLAYDGSDHARKALDIAADLARQYGSKLFLVHTYVPLPNYLGAAYYQEVLLKQMEAAQQILQQAETLLGQIPGLEVEAELLEGSPAEVILHVAEARKPDLIVMGTRGLSQMRGLLLGSQSQKVVSHAQCPVLLVR